MNLSVCWGHTAKKNLNCIPALRICLYEFSRFFEISDSAAALSTHIAVSTADKDGDSNLKKLAEPGADPLEAVVL